MSDSFVNPIFGEREQPPADGGAAIAVEGTGDHGVDVVVASMNGLDDLPIADHVAVFEQAHETLRRTLAGARPDLGATNPAAGRS
jgi:hypothetical protein